jgi:hypothetical protein
VISCTKENVEENVEFPGGGWRTVRIRIRIRIHVFLDIQDPDPDTIVRGMDPDPGLDPSIIKQK